MQVGRAPQGGAQIPACWELARLVRLFTRAAGRGTHVDSNHQASRVRQREEGPSARGHTQPPPPPRKLSGKHLRMQEAMRHTCSLPT